MKKLKNNTEKFCSFYVSNVHLVTMLIPYLRKQINKESKIIALTQSNLEEEIKMVLNKINVEKEEKEKIINIKWTSYIKNEKQLEKLIVTELKNQKDIEIIINGNKEYIEEINTKLDKLIEENNKAVSIRIINCYEVMQFNEDMNEILDKHDKILNTSGEKEIEEIFQGYKRKMA